MHASTEEFDVIVIGGGPAGSTVATLCAMQKHKVLLLDKEQHPRYSIGESLLPSTIHGICALLGVSDEIKRANFTRKFGGTFRWGTNPEPWTFHFSRAPTLNDPTGYAYQVERSKFDLILLLNAMRKGVDVRQRHSVQEIGETNGRIDTVKFTDAAGAQHVARAKYVVDASGNATGFWRHVGERVFSKFFQNVALFCYYENGKRLPPPQSGNILSAAFSDGWFWYIPLSPKLTSVGAVIAREKAAMLQGDPQKAMEGFINACPLIKEYLTNATRVTEGEYGKYRIRKDYSYMNSKFWRPGMVLVGDTACFVDPVISSGVHLATYSALQAARAINSALQGEIDERRCFEEFEARYRREYNNFFTFLSGFYDMHKDENSYFWEARKLIGSKDDAQRAFIKLVSGTNTGEAVFQNPEEMLLASRPPLSSPDAQPPATVKGEGGTFADAFDGTEVVQMMSQAQWGRERERRQGAEKPLFDGGLAPSRDGFHWRIPEDATAA